MSLAGSASNYFVWFFLGLCMLRQIYISLYKENNGFHSLVILIGKLTRKAL